MLTGLCGGRGRRTLGAARLRARRRVGDGDGEDRTGGYKVVNTGIDASRKLMAAGQTSGGLLGQLSSSQPLPLRVAIPDLAAFLAPVEPALVVVCPTFVPALKALSLWRPFCLHRGYIINAMCRLLITG